MRIMLILFIIAGIIGGCKVTNNKNEIIFCSSGITTVNYCK